MCWDCDDPWDYPDDRHDCDHSDYDIEILTGLASCNMCDHAWWASNHQIKAEVERQAAYFEWEAEQHRPWNRFKEWLKGWRFPKLLSFLGIISLKSKVAALDDEIPF